MVINYSQVRCETGNMCHSPGDNWYAVIISFILQVGKLRHRSFCDRSDLITLSLEYMCFSLVAHVQ